MTGLNRIVLNTLASYGQSLFGLVFSLLSTRWLLLALGHEDYGIFGVVGSAILLMAILTGGLSFGVTRFYAFSIGQGHQLSPDEAEDDLMRWFNAALSVHSVLPLLIVLIGLPIGEYAIHNWLTIPESRLDASIWVLRFSMVTTLGSVFGVPFVSMLTAHQRIYIVSATGVLRSLCTFLIAFTMLHTTGDRLIAYAICMACVSLFIQGILIAFAMRSFPSCRVRWAYLYKWGRIRELFSFTGWKMFGLGCVCLRKQGTPIVINLYLGPIVNAAFTVANSLSNQANTLSTALTRAFQPAVVTAEGAGDRQKMLSMAMRVCKFGALLVMAFAIPAIFEMKNLLNLWLVNPPEYSAEICQWLLAMLIVDRVTVGQALAVNAFGKIAAYEVIQGLILFSAVPLVAVSLTMGSEPSSVGLIFFSTTAVYCVGRVIFASRLVGFPFLCWLKNVVLPVVLLIVVAAGAGGFIVCSLEESLMRILVTSSLVASIVMFGAWICLLDRDEKLWIKSKFGHLQKKYWLAGSW